ncbi:hypothetical protein NC652_006219 [Populus alba x Populus x berolinensis]|nr:hypothetical protein NC652_006219 [Populus alba x Populus x berolinensis]
MQVICPANLRAKDKNKHGFDFLRGIYRFLSKNSKRCQFHVHIDHYECVNI